MSQQRYKRSFGPQEANNAPAALNLPRCQQCGKSGGLISRHVMLNYASTAGFYTVCYRNSCVYCGATQYFNTTKNGEPCAIPAFYVFAYPSQRIITERRNFLLPRELYETADGKADVGLKVRFIDALLRLQLARQSEYVFTLKEVWEEMKNAG